MGDRSKQALRVQFDGKLKPKFHGAKITSDSGSAALSRIGRGLPFDGEGKHGVVRSAPRKEHAAHHAGHVATKCLRASGGLRRRERRAGWPVTLCAQWFRARADKTPVAPSDEDTRWVYREWAKAIAEGRAEMSNPPTSLRKFMPKKRTASKKTNR